MKVQCADDIKKCLILVPHQDDETMLAGNIMKLLSESGVEIYVLYSTNGDWKYPASIRIKEAKKAISHFCHIDSNHIILLGYGDSYNDDSHCHYYYSDNVAVVTKSGHSSTYGVREMQDFSYLMHREHSPYCRDNYTRDLKEAILSVSAQMIICIDFDEHPDHRMLSLCFEEVMGQILADGDDYCPLVLKGFSYSTAYTAISDFYEKKLGQTKRPAIGETGKYQFEMIDTSAYLWNQRVCFKAPKEAQRRNLLTNSKARALSEHKSQYVVLKAERIINSDEVFWQRRTDSLSYVANVTVSDGCANYLNDYKIYNTNDIDSEIPVFTDYLWMPQDEKKEAVFEWQECQEISQIHLYGNRNTDSSVNNIRIAFDNGYKIESGPLPQNGTCLKLVFDKQYVRRCVIKIIDASGDNYGIAECEFYKDSGMDIYAYAESMSAGTEKMRELSLVEIQLLKMINTSYLMLVRIKRLVLRIISFVRRKGLKGVLDKLLTTK